MWRQNYTDMSTTIRWACLMVILLTGDPSLLEAIIDWIGRQ